MPVFVFPQNNKIYKIYCPVCGNKYVSKSYLDYIDPFHPSIIKIMEYTLKSKERFINFECEYCKTKLVCALNVRYCRFFRRTRRGKRRTRQRNCNAFFELFGLCNFGKFNIGKDRQDLATLAIRVFQEGYDAKFGITLAIPVLVCDLLIRLIWALRRFFQYKKTLKECIPTARHDDLRIMLLVGNGTLCVIDGADTLIRSGGGSELLTFFTRLNLVAWCRLVILAIKEICIRTGLALPFQKELDAFIRIREAIAAYLSELESIDIELFRKETESCNKAVHMIETANSKEDLNKSLYYVLKSLDIKLP